MRNDGNLTYKKKNKNKKCKVKIKYWQRKKKLHERTKTTQPMSTIWYYDNRERKWLNDGKNNVRGGLGYLKGGGFGPAN